MSNDYDHLPTYLSSPITTDLVTEATVAWARAVKNGYTPKRIILHRQLTPPPGLPMTIETLPQGGPQPYQLWVQVT